MQISVFLETVNCDFAHTFTINSTHRQGVVSKFRMWEILVTRKN